MFNFRNTTTACSPPEDTALRDLVVHSDSKPPATTTCYMAQDYGESYRGPLAITESGQACLHWGLPDQPGGNIFSDPLLHETCALFQDYQTLCMNVAFAAVI